MLIADVKPMHCQKILNDMEEDYAGSMKLTRKAEIQNFSMHTLRHTFATRCIEAGMRPKTLQQILGHSSINITMNLYVHVTDEEKTKEMQKFEAYASMME